MILNETATPEAATIAVTMKTPANEAALEKSAVKTKPVTDSASAAPREWEMDSAELLNPCSAPRDRASVMTVSRGNCSPMPARQRAILRSRPKEHVLDVLVFFGRL